MAAQSKEVGCTYPLGSILAAIISFKAFGSVWWALWAAVWGWLYLVYYLIRYVLL